MSKINGTELHNNVKMIVEIQDFPGSEEVLSKLNLTGLPQTEEHLEILFRTFEDSWPKLKKQARNNVKRLSSKVNGKTINPGK